MSYPYQKHIWVTREIIRREYLQNIEDGIYDEQQERIRAEGVIEESITAEENRAKAAENALDVALDALDVRVEAVESIGTRAYKASGSVLFVDLPALEASRLGNVYDIRDDFTTTSDFVEGAGKDYPAGTNVAIVAIESSGTTTYMYDVMPGFIDTSDFITNTDYATASTAGIVKPDGTTTSVNANGEITVIGGGGGSAEDVSYDNTTSGLDAENVQEAVDEIVSTVETNSDLIAPTEDGATSSDGYEVGDEIVRSGILYNVISAIAEGDAFVIGNNIDIAGSLTSQIKTLANNDDAMLNVLGAKNLCPNNAVSQTANGITFTVNADGSVRVSGTATTTDVGLAIVDSPHIISDYLVAGTYKFSGCPDGGSENTYFMRTYVDGWKILTGGEIEFTVTDALLSTDFRVTIIIKSGTTIDKIFYPMIRPASVADDTYVPYAMTNREITSKLDDTLQIRKITVTKTTDANGQVKGGIYDITGIPNIEAIIFIYLRRGSYSVFRHVDIDMYGDAGYALTFYDGNSEIASSSVTFDVYYIK